MEQNQQIKAATNTENGQKEIVPTESLPSTSTATVTAISANNLIKYPTGQASSSGLQILHVETLTSADIFANDPRQSSSTSDNSLDGPSNIKRRRKSVHVPVALNDDLEFPDMADKLANNATENETDWLSCLDNVKNMPNSNIDLISKASFLRVSVEFLMEELGLKPLVIDNNSSVANLKTQYLRNKKATKRN